MADVFKNLLSSLTGQKPVGAADDSGERMQIALQQ